MFDIWIQKQSKKIQVEVFNRISHHLSNSELLNVMSRVQQGEDIARVHIAAGLTQKYQIDLFRIRQIITERFPKEVVD